MKRKPDTLWFVNSKHAVLSNKSNKPSDIRSKSSNNNDNCIAYFDPEKCLQEEVIAKEEINAINTRKRKQNPDKNER